MAHPLLYPIPAVIIRILARSYSAPIRPAVPVWTGGLLPRWTLACASGGILHRNLVVLARRAATLASVGVPNLARAAISYTNSTTLLRAARALAVITAITRLTTDANRLTAIPNGLISAVAIACASLCVKV